MPTKLTSAAMLTLLMAIAPASSNASDISIALEHTARIQQTSTSFHRDIERQFRYSPLAPQLCQLTDDINTFTCALEEELIAGCSPGRANQLARAISARTASLNNQFAVAVRRARRGIDPPVGCTLRMERKLEALCETVECLQQEIALYQHHASPARVDLQIAPPLPPQNSHGGFLPQQGRQTSPTLFRGQQQRVERTGIHFGRSGLTIQTGSFRFSLR